MKSPRQLVISAYATMADITKVVTPDLKAPGESVLLLIDLAPGGGRLGGSALAQVYGQLGNESPDMDDPALVRRAFGAVQELIDKDLVLAGHDVSDGGLVTTLLEMAFSGNCGIDVDLAVDGKSRTEASACRCGPHRAHFVPPRRPARAPLQPMTIPSRCFSPRNSVLSSSAVPPMPP